jgi:hypothetical protein
MVKIDLLVTSNEFETYCMAYKKLFKTEQIHIYETSNFCFINTEILVIRIFSLENLNLESNLVKAGRIHIVGITHAAYLNASDELLLNILEPLCNIRIIDYIGE